MTATFDYEWNQGEDLTITLVYKSGPEGATAPVDLTSYSFRMDIVAPDGRTLAVLNDKTIPDANPYEEGSQPDSSFEVTLASDGTITINLSRHLTLPGGHFFRYITANPPVKSFAYDMFLRDSLNKQRKILGGRINIERSVTAWV